MASVYTELTCAQSTAYGAKVGCKISQIWQANWRKLHLEMVDEIEVERWSI